MFIVCLIENPVWGYILQPALVEKTEYDSLMIEEIIERKSSCYAALTDEQKTIVSHYEKYTETTLMKNFSREKHLVDFRKKIEPENIERFIRPIIESTHRKMIATIRQANIPVYFRENIKTRNLYDSNKITVRNSDADVIFNFRKEPSGELIYFIQVKSENEVIDLKSRSCATICNEPAIVVIDNRLFVFSDIDAKKLKPFFSRDCIRIPPDSYKTYIEKFVIKCVKKYEIKSEGVGINRIRPEKYPVLRLNYDLNMQPVLSLSFRYDKKIFQSNDYSKQKIVYTEEKLGETVINWYERDKVWENSTINRLTAHGLKHRDDCNFYVETPENADNTDKIGAIIRWIQSNDETMKNFEFSQSVSKSPYYTGKITTVMQTDKKQDWFDVNCVIVFDNFQIPFSRFRNHILEGIREYVLPDNTIVILPEEWFAYCNDIMYFGKKSGDNIRLDKRLFRLLDDWENWAKQWENPAKQTESFKNIPVPENINIELYNYQKKGFSWLVYLYKNNFGGCLADDMGLGKTLQTIVLLQYIANETVQTQGQTKRSVSLIVMPTSLLFNWQNELKRFAPSLCVYPYTGKNRLKDKNSTSIFADYDVIITTYATLRNDVEILSCFAFRYLVLDESQYVKNPESQTYKAVKQIMSQYKLSLTGTPVENSLSDLWAQFNIINEGMLGSHSSFKKRYVNPIKKEDKQREQALLRMIQPFMLRRTKSEVAPELPPITEEIIYCDMSDEQAEYYETEKSKIRNNLISDEALIDPKRITFIVLQGLMRLRLLANHPRFVDEEYTGDSGKFEQVVMYIEGLIAENHKVLIFSSFVKHLRLFSDYLDKQNRRYAWLSGSTIDRENEINKFINDKDIHCFFISLKAGGVGLNLTVADYVFILDPWWNPAAEMQAISRSHRIGQNKNVMVYRFISTQTIEEKIRRLQENKAKLADKFVASANPLNTMSEEEIKELLSD
ncbi:MAG: DEAD/DEAH box helicase [Bacteroidales bacterium]|jgi:SNF2 family DNA or RNA helicase|nr:DEAD/DEAH box helicase [Bacteroidales bacterium]